MSEIKHNTHSGDTEAGFALHKTVVLVGMMGAGKTAVGRALAARLGVPFLDSDAEIESAANMTIPEIFERDGEADSHCSVNRKIWDDNTMRRRGPLNTPPTRDADASKITSGAEQPEARASRAP